MIVFILVGLLLLSAIPLVVLWIFTTKSKGVKVSGKHVLVSEDTLTVINSKPTCHTGE